MTMTNPSASVRRVGPQEAAAWLALSQSYGKIRDRHVELLARQMDGIHWRVVGSTCISFAGSLRLGTARLVEGRHILHAVIRSGRAIDIFVAENVAEDADVIINTGRITTFSEYLYAARKVPNARTVGAASRMLYLESLGLIGALGTGGGQYKPTNEELMEWFDQNDSLVDSASSGIKVRTELPAHANETALTAAHYRFGLISEDVRDRFFTAVADGSLATMKSFYNWNSRMKPPWRGARQYACLILAWNGYRRDRTPRTVKWSTVDPFPVPI